MQPAAARGVASSQGHWGLVHVLETFPLPGPRETRQEAEALTLPGLS